MRQRHTQRLADNLGGGRRAQKLTPAAGRGASPAEILCGSLQRDLIVREARADALYPPGIFALFGRQGNPAGRQHARQIVHGG